MAGLTAGLSYQAEAGTGERQKPHFHWVLGLRRSSAVFIDTIASDTANKINILKVIHLEIKEVQKKTYIHLESDNNCTWAPAAPYEEK